MTFISNFYADHKRFPTGRGSRDSKKNKPYEVITLKQIVDSLEDPCSTPKEHAPWFIPSNYFGPWARKHEVQLECGRFSCLTIDIDQNSPRMFEVIEACQAICGDVHMLIYSSASASQQEQKWRVILPLQSPLNGYTWQSAQLALFDDLKKQGLPCDHALSRTGQLVFLPNVPPDKRDDTDKPLFYEQRKIVGAHYATL